MRLLDLFCGAGGAARGYSRAGFEVVGVDIEPQPNYCGDEFFQADAVEFPWNPGDFDAVHASPPCQAHTALRALHIDVHYPDLIADVRLLLHASGLPYVIENVVGAPLLRPVQLCGSSFGLRVWRHRLFEMSCPPVVVPPCSHEQFPLPIDVTGPSGPSNKPRVKPGGGVSRKPANLAEAREAMGIGWMTRRELSEAIPPAYTEHIGGYLMAECVARREVAA